MLSIGIVGLPNVGKSTLFNAITNSESAEAANYPFCTIDPNVGIVDVNDKRLDALANISSSEKIVRSQIKFVDIAGLVRGASKGEGLGNKFLSNIRDVNAICHVVRCFENENITHVDASVDPLRDLETINLELILSDLELLNKVIDKDKRLELEVKEVISKAIKILEEENFLNTLTSEELEVLKPYNLLTTKKILIVMNVNEDEINSGNKYTKLVEEYANKSGYKSLAISAKTEYEISLLDVEDRVEFLEALCWESTCLDRLILSSYALLGLISFFTTGPKETRSWTISLGDTAYEAASKIHNDIQRGFIRAEVTSYKDFIELEGKAKEKGLLRLEGKSYIVEDGDVIYFRFNV